MPKRVPLKEAAVTGAANGHSANGAATATAVMVPPPPASSEARGDAPWSSVPGDAPPSLYVARRVRAIAEGEEWPPSNATPAWLAGRESAIAGDPGEFNPHMREEDTSAAEKQLAAEWADGWQCGTAEANATASNEPTEGEGEDAADEQRQPKQHPEGHFDLFLGIPADETFEGLGKSSIESQAIAILGRGLIDNNSEFKHLRNLDIRWRWKRNGGAPNAKVRFGAAHHPEGFLRDELNTDWLIWLAADHFRNVRPTKRQVEACLYHQLSHAQVTSKGKLTVAPHSFEGFPAELTRYGAWNSDLVTMLEAAGKKPGPEVVQSALNLDGVSSADEDEESDDDEDDD